MRTVRMEPGASGAEIQNALDSLFLQGGGELRIPGGHYVIGGIRLRSRTTLYLERGAELCGTRDIGQYDVLARDTLEPLPPDQRTGALFHTPGAEEREHYAYEWMRAGSRWNHALISAFDAEEIAVIGEEDSLIDGCDPFDPLGEEQYRGPHGIGLFRCRNVRLEGYTIRNTGNWAHSLNDSEMITIRDVTCLAGHDGFHMTGSSDVRILDCDCYTGDDCIAGIDNVNVYAARCRLNTACSAFRFGGTDALFEDCSAWGPCRYWFRGSLTAKEKAAGSHTPARGRSNMLSMFTYYADFSHPIRFQPGRIVFRRCRVKDSDRFLHYNYSGSETWQNHRPLADLRFEDCEAEGLYHPLHFYGDSKVPFTLELERVRLAFREDPDRRYFMMGANWSRLELKDVSFDGNARALLGCWGEPGTVVTEHLLSPVKTVVFPEELFRVTPI